MTCDSRNMSLYVGLAEIGKRSLLILNKTDLYSEADKETILARLRQRVRGFIAIDGCRGDYS
jgi:G3E family GTPase